MLTSATFSGQQQTSVLASPALETASGTSTNTSGTYGIGSGIVLSSGAVEERSYVDTDLSQTIVLPGYGDGPNAFPDPGYYSGTAYLVDSVQTPASAEQEALLDPVYGPFDHYDATELLITFDMLPGYSAVTFNVAYGTEEYTNFINSAFVDIFAAFLNGANVALVGNKPVNVDHPDFAAVSGTELNGLLAPGGNPLLTFSGAVNPAGNTLRLIITDTGDSVLDSTVYVSGLTAVPLPASVWLLVTGLAGLVLRAKVGEN